MRMIIVVTIAFLISLTNVGFSSTPEPNVAGSQIRASLPDKLNHPYLYFTEADKPAIKRRIRENPVYERIYQELKRQADSYLGKKSVRKPNVRALAFVYQMTEDKRYAQKAFEFLSGEYPKLSGTFDLKNSRRCRALAELYDWLYTGLTQEQRSQLQKRLMRHLDLVEGRYDKNWWTTAYRCNWNPVCNSAVGVAAAALVADDPTMVDLMAEAYNGIYRTYDEIGKDGSWCEGVNYWSYGLFVSLLYADALNNLTDGEFDLLSHEKIAANPVTFGIYTLIPPGPHVKKPYAADGSDWKAVNFEDSGNGREDSSYKYNKIAEATGSGEAIWLKETIFGAGVSQDNSIEDIIWPEPDIEPSIPRETSKLFRDYGWAVMRSDFTSSDSFVLAAVCAEHWDPTREVFIARHKGADLIPASTQPWGIELKNSMYFFSHGHLHAGTFNLYWKGQAYISDLGVPGRSYPKNYWTPERWDYIFANSFGHNVVHVNDEGQISGKDIGGEIIDFRTSERIDYTLMDPTGAYPEGTMEKWRRHLVLEKPALTVVLDELQVNKGDKINIRFHSDCEMMLSGRVMLIKGRSGLMALIPVIEEKWKFVLDEHWLNHKYPDWSDWRKPEPFEDNTTEYLDITWDASQSDNLAATVIVPVGDLQEAKLISDSAKLNKTADGNVILSFEKSEKVFKYEFISCDGNLLMK